LIKGFNLLAGCWSLVVKAVVFDLDGTIASFNVDYMTVRAEVRGLLISSGLPASILQANESIFDMLQKSEIFVKNNGKPAKMMKNMRDKALAIAEKYELEAARTTTLLPGVVGALKAVKKMSLKIGLCTINSERATNQILERFKIAMYFDAVVSRDKVRYVKPNSEHLEATLKALGVSAKEALLIGDGVRDMQCASDLKVIAVGLSAGVSSGKELTSFGANYLITSIADLPMLIERINGSAGSQGLVPQ
jgi:phosphoglycolate phosphatase